MVYADTGTLPERNHQPTNHRGTGCRAQRRRGWANWETELSTLRAAGPTGKRNLVGNHKHELHAGRPRAPHRAPRRPIRCRDQLDPSPQRPQVVGQASCPSRPSAPRHFQHRRLRCRLLEAAVATGGSAPCAPVQRYAAERPADLAWAAPSSCARVFRFPPGGIQARREPAASACGDAALLLLFSSVTALMGNAGQCTYGAANGALEKEREVSIRRTKFRPQKVL